MIIGVDYFNYGFDQQFYDTPIPTSEIDEVMMGAGMYDEMFISVDTTLDDSQTKPLWTLSSIILLKLGVLTELVILSPKYNVIVENT